MEPDKTAEIGPKGFYKLEIHHCTGMQSHEINVPSIYDTKTNKCLFWTSSLWDVTSHTWHQTANEISMSLRYELIMSAVLFGNDGKNLHLRQP